MYLLNPPKDFFFPLKIEPKISVNFNYFFFMSKPTKFFVHKSIWRKNKKNFYALRVFIDFWAVCNQMSRINSFLNLNILSFKGIVKCFEVYYAKNFRKCFHKQLIKLIKLEVNLICQNWNYNINFFYLNFSSIVK